MSKKQEIINPVSIALLYVVSGVLWILFSDTFLASLVDDIELLTRLQMYKGWVYVVITGGLLYLLIRLYSSHLRATGAELRSSEARYRNIVEQSGYAIVLFRPNLEIQYCSPAITRVLGFSPEELTLGKAAGDFVHPDYLQKLQDMADSLVSGRQRRITLEIPWRSKDAGWTWTECILSDFPLGKENPENLIMLQLRDISRIKELYQQADQSHKKFENLFQHAPVGFIIHGPDKKIKDINQAALNITGYSRNDMDGSIGWADIIDPDQVPFFEKRWDAIFRTGWLDNAPYKIRKKNGELIEVVANARLLQDEQTGDYVVLSNVVDVTEKNRSEELLRQSENRYRFLFKNNPLPMWIYDKETLAFIDVNDRTVEHYGYSRDEFLSMTIRDIRPPEDLPLLMRNYGKKIDGLQYAGIWRHRKKDGSVFEAEIIASRIRLDGRDVEIILAHDVTDRMRAEAELRESEAKFRKLANTVQAIVVIYRGEEMVFVNRGAEIITGYSAEELRSRTFWDIVHPENQEDVKRMGFSRLRGEEIERDYDFRILRKDGAERWISISSTPIQFEGGTAAIATGFDVTDRKQAEMKIRELNRVLEQRVSERTAALLAVNQELEAFSYSVSHDLMAPLRGIDGFSKALLEHSEKELDETGRQYLARIRSATGKMGELIDELLKLSRITRAEMRVEMVNITALARDVMDEILRINGERQVDFRCDRNIQVAGDRGLMRIVLANLLGNAYKFTSKREKAIISVAIIRGGSGFSVSDNGAGFNMEYYSKLFTPFQRLHKSTEFEGIGIGLATVSRIIKKHGGSIDALSKPDEGTTFFVKLPLPLSDAGNGG